MIITLEHEKNLCVIFKILVLLILFINIPITFSQNSSKVTAAKDQIAVVNIGSNSGITTGEKYILKRRTSTGIIEVGIIRIEKTLPDKCGIRLIEIKGANNIQEGDFLGNIVEDSFEELFGNDEQQSTYHPKTNTSYLQKNGDSNKAVYDAERAAELDANQSMWFAMGCLFGPFGWLISEASTPSPNASILVGKEPEYVALYTDTYRTRVKKIRSDATITGCLISTGAETLLYLLLVSAASSNASSY